MRYRTVSLYDLMSLEHEIGKSEIMKILSDFSCPLNPDVEFFMHYKAYDFERIGLARTYLVYAQPDYEDAFLVGIYSLGQSNVEISEKLTKGYKRKIFGTTYPMGKNIKTLLIGQLAKNYTNGYNKYITGDLLLSLAFLRIKEIHTIFPSVVTHVDCKDDIHLRKFYERHGFELLKKREDEMLVYLLPTNKIIESVTGQEQQEEKILVNV